MYCYVNAQLKHFLITLFDHELDIIIFIKDLISFKINYNLYIKSSDDLLIILQRVKW